MTSPIVAQSRYGPLLGSFSPHLRQQQVVDIVRNNYGMVVKSIKQFEGYDDKNYHIEVSNDHENPFIKNIWKHGYVLKIMNSVDSKYKLVVQAQHELVKYLSESGIEVPIPVQNVKENTFSLENFMPESEAGNIVRLMIFIPGEVLLNTDPTDEKLRNIGEFVGRLTLLLKGFQHIGFDERRSLWMLENVLTIRNFLSHVKKIEQIDLVKKTLAEFEMSVIPILKHLERGVIHGDINQNNILVKGNEVAGLLDFSDSHYSACIFDLVICICYVILYTKNIGDVKYVLQGYNKARTISEEEQNIIKVSVCARLCQSLVLGLYSSHLDPGNDYILSSQKEGWHILEKLSNLTDNQLFELWEIK